MGCNDKVFLSTIVLSRNESYLSELYYCKLFHPAVFHESGRGIKKCVILSNDNVHFKPGSTLIFKALN